MSVQPQIQFDDFQSKMDSQEATFLSVVAKDLLQKFGQDLSKITVVFPNRRARLFFNEYLCQASDTPVWAPSYVSLDELFKQASDLKLADPLKLLSDLFTIYNDVYNRNREQAVLETFDEFFFFGEILLSDFNDVDKNMVNDMALFSNLEELDKLKDDFEHLDMRQWATVERFFKDISTNRTQLKEAFFSIWNILGEVYTSFKTKLKNEGIAYDGMLFRSVVESLQENGTAVYSQQKYAFVGFNVLTECEKALFKILKQNNKALFYWDFDDYYMAPQHEAGRFMRQNLQQFGNDLKEQDSANFIRTKKTVKIVESSSESAQAGYISTWVNDLGYAEQDAVPDTSIVLCSEQNLQAVMQAIPGETALGNKISANITMGFPLTQTPVFSLLMALAELQLKGVDANNNRYRYNFVLPVLRHPYIRLVFPEAGRVQARLVKDNNFFPSAEDLNIPSVFKACTDSNDLSSYLLNIIKIVALKFGEQEVEADSFHQLYSESLFRVFQNLNRMSDLVKNDMPLEKATFIGLLKRYLSTTSVPFHGEPARGLQVMGVLETRNMDFRNVMMLSTNEGVMPKSDNESSFIPHFIRKFFNMTTIEHQDSLYAYYFYRLLQRAENVVLVYNASNAQTGKMEKSRFLLQMLTESGLDIKRINLKADMHPHVAMDLTVRKSDELLAKIRNKYDFNINAEASKLSPSALNNYMDCSLRFYLQYIENIRPPQELSDELDNSVLGKVFHKTVELIYQQLGHADANDPKSMKPYVVNADMLEGYLKLPNRIDKAIELAFNEEYFGKRKVSRERYNGEQLIYFDIVRHFVRRLLQLDKRHAPFAIVGLELPKYRDIDLSGMKLRVGGIIDRLDSKNGELRVVDYKTGGTPKEVKKMEKLFEASKDRANYIFQAFVYSSILTQEQPEPVSPALMYIQKAVDEEYSPTITWDKKPIEDFRELADEFEEYFQAMLTDLFNPALPFSQTEITDNCKYCDFKGMCGR